MMYSGHSVSPWHSYVWLTTCNLSRVKFQKWVALRLWNKIVRNTEQNHQGVHLVSCVWSIWEIDRFVCARDVLCHTLPTHSA